MSRGFLRLQKDERGASMILILVLIAFLSILLSVLMTTTFVNYRMKLTSLQSREAFYMAESDIEAVRLRVVEEVSSAMTKSYLDAAEDGSLFTEEGEEEMVRAFRTQLKTRLKRAQKEIGFASLEDKDDRILLKGFSVTSKEESGITTRIRTDIAVLLPDAEYSKQHALLEGKDLVVYEGFTQD